MASQQMLQLFKAIYDGDLPTVKALHDNGVDIINSNFVIETDEVCLCGAAFENLGLEFTTITSPSRDICSNSARRDSKVKWDVDRATHDTDRATHDIDKVVQNRRKFTKETQESDKLINKEYVIKDNDIVKLDSNSYTQEIVQKIDKITPDEEVQKVKEEEKVDQDKPADENRLISDDNQSPAFVINHNRDTDEGSDKAIEVSDLGNDKDQIYDDTGQNTPTPDTPSLTVTDPDDVTIATTRENNQMTASLMSASFMSTGRRVYEPPLGHWLEQGRCSHINDQNDLDYDYLEDLEDLEVDGDDLAKDLDLEVYGIRLSPHPMTEDGMSVSISSDLTDRICSLQMSDSMEEAGASVNSDDEPSATSSGPSLHINPDLLAYINRHYTDDDSVILQTPLAECKFPYVHGLDSMGSDTGSGILVGSVKVASITPLHVAAARGQDEVVTFLLATGCKVNAVTSDTEETPLHLACRWGRCSVVRKLLDRGADPVHTSTVECSPMHVAIELSCSECLTAMLAKLPSADDLATRVKESLLVYALVRDNVELARSLLDKFNTDINETLVVEAGQTFLHKGAGAGSVKCVHLLAEKGANLQAANSDGETALHLAASCGHVGTVQALLQAGAVPRTSTNWMIGDNQTPLMLAAYNNYPDVIDALLPYDDINCQSECGDTALHYCAFRGCLQGVEALIAAGSHVNLRNQYAATALWNGACYADIVTALVKAGASTKVKSVGHDLDHLRGAVYDYPRTPLEIALEEGFLDTAMVLLQAGCSLPRMRALELLEHAHKRYDLESSHDLYETIRHAVCSVMTLKNLSRRCICTLLDKHDDSCRHRLIADLPVIDDANKAYLRFDDL